MKYFIAYTQYTVSDSNVKKPLIELDQFCVLKDE